MAIGNIVAGLFGDLIPSVRQAARGYTMVDDELMPSRLVKPEIMTGPTGTSRIMEMDEFQGIKQEQRKQNLEIAMRMAEEGADNREIAARTGFGFYEGQPMMEINDDAAKLAKPFTEVDVKKTYKAPQLLKHDDFYKVYPEMKDLKIKFYEGEPPESNIIDNGYFNIDSKTIGINKNSWFMSNPSSGALNFEEMDDDIFELVMQTMLHEAQHAVQVAEKLPGGASAEDFMKGGSSGLKLNRKEAQRRYARNIGEMWARNVAERFQGMRKTKEKDNPWETLGKDEDSELYQINAKDAILPSGASTNPYLPFEDVEFKDPFPDTTKEQF